jgi:mono/diheme cytochrome c family protein
MRRMSRRDGRGDCSLDAYGAGADYPRAAGRRPATTARTSSKEIDVIQARGGIVAAAALVFVLGACAGGDSDTQTPAGQPAGEPAQPAAPTVGANVQLPEMVAQGQQLFNQQICWTCHGQNATGGALAPALNDQEWLNSDGSYESILQVIHTGVPSPVQYTTSPMPPMGGAQLTEEQMRQLAAYVYAVSRGG